MTEPPAPGRWPGQLSRRRWVILVALVVGAGVPGTLLGLLSPWNDDRSGRPPTSQRQAFGFDAAYSDPDPLVLVVRYGDSSSCPSAAVRHTVVQEPGRVVVTLTRAAIPAGQACTSDYGARLVRVSLTTPLGSRAVIDGSRTRPVPLSTGPPPFG
jgi:hypothetical protein